MNLIIKKSDCKPGAEHIATATAIGDPLIQVSGDKKTEGGLHSEAQTSQSVSGAGFHCDDTQCYIAD